MATQKRIDTFRQYDLFFHLTVTNFSHFGFYHPFCLASDDFFLYDCILVFFFIRKTVLVDSGIGRVCQAPSIGEKKKLK